MRCFLSYSPAVLILGLQI
jgi:hypothetical protein